ncbi:MAG: DUF3179 domain-containing (seleno)protein [Ilumatobacter sp.]
MTVTPRTHAFVASGAAVVVAALVGASCSSSATDSAAGGSASTGLSESGDGPAPGGAPVGTTARPPVYVHPEPPEVPDGANVEASAAIDRITAGINAGALDPTAVADLAASGDARHAWFVSDLLRFFQGDDDVPLVESFETMTGISIADDPELSRSPWSSVTNHLIAWDTPDYDGYREDKAVIYEQLEPRWAPFFDDVDADIDWRYVSWGGVRIDDRPLGDPEGCPSGCIPALDDPATTDASGGDWYPDDRIVFGIVVNGESVAIPLNIAEIHEMFNLTLGGRRLAVPYCTLCGSAQAYFTDQADGSPTPGADEVPIGRTSGLLSRSNKVMYDLVSLSVFDTFTGAAVSGPLQDAGVVLQETTVVRSTWAEWKREHPDTRIVAEDGGIGRSYELDPLGGRDDDGPIFPIGDVDPRLDVQEFVVGVLLDDGTALAFPSDEATAAFDAGATVELGGVELRRSGDGVVAIDVASGDEVTAHEAFWFAWSQFHPDTLLWRL